MNREKLLKLPKFILPKVSPTLHRERLYSLLDSYRDKSSLWISAPAGSGKTTLVSGYLQQRNLEGSYYHIDESDDDPATFFYHFTLLNFRHSKDGNNHLPFLTPEYLQCMEKFSQNYFRNFFQTQSNSKFLVIDNVHLVQEKEIFQKILISLLREAPTSITVILLSRKNPNGSMLKQVLCEKLKPIYWSDIKFTADETSNLTQILLPDQAKSLQNSDHIHELVEGWPAGLVLIMKYIQGHTSLSNIELLDQSSVFDYLGNELFINIDDKTRLFLLKTAFLTHLTPDSANRMTDSKNGKEFLEHLSDNNFLVSRVTESEILYQYHPLYQQFLRTKAEQYFDKAEVISLKNTAAKILSEDGFVYEACTLYKSIKNWDDIILIILEHYETFMRQGRQDVIKNWILDLPESIIQANPQILVCLGTCYLYENAVIARSHLTNAFNLFQQTKNVDGMYTCWSHIAKTFVFEFIDFEPANYWLKMFDKLQSNYPDIDDPALKARVVYAFVTLCTFTVPSHPKLKDWVTVAEQILLGTKQVELKALMVNALIGYYLWMGEVAKIESLSSIIEILSRNTKLTPLLQLFIKLAQTSYQWMTAQSDLAIDTAQSALQFANDRGIGVLRLEILMQCALAAIVSGKLKLANECLTEIRTIKPSYQHLELGQVQYLQGIIHLFDDSPASSEYLLIQSFHIAQSSHFIFPSALAAAKVAQALISQNKLAEAKQYLDYIQTISHQTGSKQIAFLNVLLNIWHAIREDNKLKIVETLSHTVRNFDPGNNRAYACSLLLPDMLFDIAKHAISNKFIQFGHDIIHHFRILPDISCQHLEAWPHFIKIYTLGKFSILIDGNPIEFYGKIQKKPLALLQILIAAGGLAISKNKLIDTIWPDAEGDAGSDSLKTTINRLRKLLTYKNSILVCDDKISLNNRYCWVDSWSFEQMPVSMDTLALAIDLYSGEFLADQNDIPIIITKRESLKRKFTTLIDALGQHYEASREWRSAIHVYQKGLDIDDSAEAFYQGLMRCYSEIKLLSEIKKIFRQCEILMANKFQMRPSDSTCDLYKLCLANSQEVESAN